MCRLSRPNCRLELTLQVSASLLLPLQRGPLVHERCFETLGALLVGGEIGGEGRLQSFETLSFFRKGLTLAPRGAQGSGQLALKRITRTVAAGCCFYSVGRLSGGSLGGGSLYGLRDGSLDGF